MINGLVFEVDSEELKKIFLKRGELHEKKAKYLAELAEKASDEPVPADLVSNRTVTNAKAEYLRRSENEHRLALKFKFMADHLIEKEIYRLSMDDFQRLELNEFQV